MREVQVSDDSDLVWLSPERCRAARALLNWTPTYLAQEVRRRTGQAITAADVTEFEDYGLMLDTFASAGVLAVLLCKVEFTTAEGEPGVVRKRHVGEAQGGGYVQFGGKPRRRPPL